MVNALATPEELAAGASIGHVGLELPPRPLLVGMPSAPDVRGLKYIPSECLSLFFIFLLLSHDPHFS